MLNPSRLRAAIDIAAPPKRVWAIVSDPTRWTAWAPPNAEIKLLTERADTLGASWIVSVQQGGKRTETRTTVTEIDPPGLQVTRTETPFGIAWSRLLLAPNDVGTRLTMVGEFHWNAGMQTWLGRLLTPLLTPRSTQRILHKIKGEAENVT